jgi:hypothetical protein
MVLEPDGSMLVAGDVGTGALCRLRPDGALDKSYGKGGVVHVGYTDMVRAIALDSIGSDRAPLWLAHAEKRNEYFSVLFQMRADGAPDLDFGDAGFVHVSSRYPRPVRSGSYGHVVVSIFCP